MLFIQIYECLEDMRIFLRLKKAVTLFPDLFINKFSLLFLFFFVVLFVFLNTLLREQAAQAARHGLTGVDYGLNPLMCWMAWATQRQPTCLII